MIDANAQSEPAADAGDTLTDAARLPDGAGLESQKVALEVPDAPRIVLLQFALVVLGTIDFHLLARPIVMFAFLAVVAAMALVQLMRWLGYFHIPPAASEAILLCLLLASGDMFLHKLVRAMPTLRDKKREIRITNEMLSVPIVGSIKVVCDRVPSLSPVSELLSPE